MEGDNAEKIKKVIHAALTHARRLEEEAQLKGKLKFRGEEWQFIVNDRLLSPNTHESLMALEPDLKEVFQKLFGGASYALERHPDPRERLTLEVKAEKPFRIETLLNNIA